MIDEYDCPSGLTCENLEGSYTCTVACQPGTERTSDGKSCTDIDECQTDQHSCQQVLFYKKVKIWIIWYDIERGGYDWR